MNRTALKSYAPKARLDFIRAVTDRAAFVGLTPDRAEPMEQKGDVVIIGGQPFPRRVAEQRKKLQDRISQHGFAQVMEAMAYTWFNRFVALRYMELHGYLEHGYRVLSHPEGKPTPEILEHAEHVTLPGLDAQQVINLKLDGSQDAELYRLLLVAQCNGLHEAMPFLFEKIADETELLLPDNLLHSDSLIRKLVTELDEADWQQVEIIGWLYQFYISDKKNEVIGKVVKSEDIPAATQLFTPNWIVKYLVQNTLGRQWLATYPDSPLRQQMEYYIAPAAQTDDVQAQLAAITPKSLDPETLTLLDPASGSGHILVEAYDLFKAIYQERGYRSKDIPRLILEKNLFGLEIDDRAAQLAAFALLMKARADDRRIFADHVQPNVIAIQESKGLENLLRPDPAAAKGVRELPFADSDLFPQTEKQLTLTKPNQESPLAAVEPCLRELIKLFEHGKTFGSLIRVPPDLAAQLPSARQSIEAMIAKGQLWEHRSATLLLPLVKQAEMLATQHDAVVANPPYIGSKYHIPILKKFLHDNYDGYEKDVFSAFIDRNFTFSKQHGRLGLMSPFVWMFISSYEQLRGRLIDKET
ncbi:MAG: BREX-1 system adenine-specific DNA-methyltransferase PglX, partial [Verrucomicrobiota bacterium]